MIHRAAALFLCCLAPSAVAQFVPDDPLYDSGGPYPTIDDGQWNLRAIQVDRAWEITTGSDEVVIAVLDNSHRLDHEDLAGALWTNPDEIPNNGIDDDLNGYIDDIHGCDFTLNSGTASALYFHATPVTGIALARTDNAKGLAGVAGGEAGELEPDTCS